MEELRIGQQIRISKATLELGVPTRDASLIWSHEDGVIDKIKRVDTNLIQIRARCSNGGKVEANVRLCLPSGPRLSEYGQRITILRNAPEQWRLMLPNA